MATVIIAALPFQDRLAAMHLPRLVLTPHLMGRPLGPPGARQQQYASLTAALALLEHATQPQRVVLPRRAAI